MAAAPRSGRCSKELGIKSTFIDGLRVTDEATVEVVEMVLTGSINKQIVTGIQAAGGRAVGLSGKDGNLVVARKVEPRVRSRNRREGRGRPGLCRRTGNRQS